MRTENKHRVLRFVCDYPNAVLRGVVWRDEATGRRGPKYELAMQAVEEGLIEFDPLGRAVVVKHEKLVFSVPSDKVHIVRKIMTEILGYVGN